MTQKITPCLWYNRQAEEAVDFYLSIFPDAKKHETIYYTEDHEFRKEGDVLTIEFELFGTRYVALNAGPEFPFTDAVSFMVACDTQKEIDYYWEKLMEGGGHPEQCGWLRDKFGVPWQIYWPKLMEMHRDKNPTKRKAVMDAMMKMVKIDIAELKKAYDAA